MQTIKIIKAIDGVCAWPNLTLLPDGTIIAIIWNQPCHGKWEGDVDCYASTDGGETWARRGQVTQHEPGTNRMNLAAGLAANGDLLALVSGWNRRGAIGTQTPFEDAVTLRAWTCRSSDGGYSWLKTGELPDSEQQHAYIPFGDIVRSQDGMLCFSAYTINAERDRQNAFLFRSGDDGQSWGNKTLLHPAGSETALIHLGARHWLAASRNTHLDLAVSDDDGRSWEVRQPLSQKSQYPGHFLLLRDGTILLSYGNRVSGQCGVEARLSFDGGNTWSDPLRLADMPHPDGGYPSSVQREDGVIVTAFYSKQPEPGKNRYQMDVVLWAH